MIKGGINLFDALESCIGKNTQEKILSDHIICLLINLTYGAKGLKNRIL
jgi:hypothetical protein